jgi:hypothetical protein
MRPILLDGHETPAHTLYRANTSFWPLSWTFVRTLRQRDGIR